MSYPVDSPPMVDVAFAIRAVHLQKDCAFELQQALCTALPWIADDALSGIHPLRTVEGNGPFALFPARARLLVRVRRERAADLQALTGCALSLGRGAMHLGESHIREVLPHGTLYAYRVACADSDEAAFMARVAQELAAMGITGQRVCGLHQTLMNGPAVQHAFSLLVHGLEPEQSQRLQQSGLGPQRLLGCGVFVPHKSAAAV